MVRMGILAAVCLGLVAWRVLGAQAPQPAPHETPQDASPADVTRQPGLVAPPPTARSLPGASPSAAATRPDTASDPAATAALVEAAMAHLSTCQGRDFGWGDAETDAPDTRLHAAAAVVAALLAEGRTNRGDQPTARMVAQGLRGLKDRAHERTVAALAQAPDMPAPRAILLVAVEATAFLRAYAMTASPIFKLPALDALQELQVQLGGGRLHDAEAALWVLAAQVEARALHDEGERGRSTPGTPHAPVRMGPRPGRLEAGRFDPAAFAGLANWTSPLPNGAPLLEHAARGMALLAFAEAGTESETLAAWAATLPTPDEEGRPTSAATQATALGAVSLLLTRVPGPTQAAWTEARAAQHTADTQAWMARHATVPVPAAAVIEQAGRLNFDVARRPADRTVATAAAIDGR